MNNKLILQSIGDKLLSKGNCPYDATCPFGRGQRCGATGEQLEEKIKQVEEKIKQQPHCLPVRNTLDPSPWPCNDVITVQFTSDWFKKEDDPI